MPLFDIIIPTYNNLEELKRCLSSFENQSITDFRIWICVDGSTDGTVEWLYNSHYPFTYKILCHPDNQNKGRAATRNLALPYLSAPYIAMVDSDLTPTATFLEEHYNVVSHGDVSLGGVQYSDINNIWTDYITTRGKFQYGQLQEVPFYNLDSENVSMPSTYFTQVGGFDMEIIAYGGEDTLLGHVLHTVNPKLKFIINKKALLTGQLEKSLELSIAQRELFAKEVLPFIERKYPAFTELFHFTFLKSRQAFLLYSFLHYSGIGFITKKTITILPTQLRRKGIYMLLFIAMSKGYHQR